MNTSALEEIIRTYQNDVKLDPSDARAHHHLAMYYSRCNDYPMAVNHFEAALSAAPDFIDAHYHAGILFFKHEKWEKAQAQFLSVLRLDEKHIYAHFYSGALLLQVDKLNEAEQHFQFVLAINPDHAPALVNLGVLELKREAGQIAISYFTQALVLDSKNLEARRNLAATFMHYDRFENALVHYDELQKINALEIEDLYNMGVANAALGQLSTAIDYYQQVIAQHDTHSSALNNLAAIYIRLGQRSEAIALLQRALQVNQGDSASQFMFDVLTNNKKNPAASHEYVRHLFNNYALYYEQHLQKILRYSLPEQSLEILRSLHVQKFQHVLDLGCGTGLSGILLRNHSIQMTGVDLSHKMLMQARSKNVYDCLIEKDIISFLRDDPHHYDLIQALDVLPYFGELEELFDAIVPRMTENGLLVLSAEISEKLPWVIQDSMRFCHSSGYIQLLLTTLGLQLLHQSQGVARKENDQNLYAHIIVYKKCA